MTLDFSLKGLLAVCHLKYARLWTWLGLSLIFGICFMSLVSVPTPIRSFMFNDKLMHMLVYACLMGWFAQIFRHDLTRVILIVLFVAMGIAIEYMQALVPSRQFEVLDMLANTSGVVLAWALSYTWLGTILERFEKVWIAMITYSHSASIAK